MITIRYIGEKATRPIHFPKTVNGTIRAMMLKVIEVAYTGSDALLLINGVLAVLII